MQTIIATAVVSEHGSVERVTLVSDHNYQSEALLSMYGSPYLGTFENGEEWREALSAYLMGEAIDRFQLAGVGTHGGRLAYVSPQCSLYVYEFDFDVKAGE